VKLSELAADIDAQRQQLVNFINSVAEEIYASIAGSKEQLSLAYRSSINASGTKDHTDHTDDDTNSAAQNFESLFLQQLESNIHRDIGAGFTTIGPHRDDFEITFKNSMVTAVASRGEMRTIVLVLKLAEITYIEDKNQQPPILLLDDVFSELDQTRRTFLIKTLDKYQSIITTTDADMARQLGSSHVIETAPETTPKGTDKPTTSLKNNRKAT
jgi:DNA replication and repair protein RecF